MAPDGLWMYRSKLFGGMSAEVLTIFNKSDLMARLKGMQIRSPFASFNF
jgi:hypothetical protein